MGAPVEQVPVKSGQEKSRSPGTGVTGCCEPTQALLRTKLGSFVRSARTLN